MDLILVDKNDRPVGSMEKMEVHRKGLLHRAFSIFIFNSNNEMLLQRRAMEKYHSGGLWTNACCSHPTSIEPIKAAAEKRLQEEMGFTVPLTKAFDFIYQAKFENGLSEYEFDHVFTGVYNGPIDPDNQEVMDFRFEPINKIRASILHEPQNYTAWFKIAFPKLEAYLAAL
jgi:isopentenyl-diphosphate delta-isomerase